MNKKAVRCWKVVLFDHKGTAEGNHWIAFPEDNGGHDLVSCVNCGYVYAVDVSKLVYVGPPLSEKVQNLACLGCGGLMKDFLRPYPEAYRDKYGCVLHFERPTLLPADEDSQVVPFDQLYD